MTLRSFVKRTLRRPANLLVSSSSNIPASVRPLLKEVLTPLLMEEPAMAAKFLPYHGGEVDYILDRVAEPALTVSEGLPVPPVDLWQGYGRSIENFLATGRDNVGTMRDIVNRSNFSIQAGYRILDFGCAAGRMIRFFNDVAEQCEVWGVDISAEHIIWCQRHLSPPFHFATTTSFPHLPFEDRYFDLIYAGSVFTHIADLADAWLLELRRVTRTNGRIYITINDNNTVKSLRETQKNPGLSNLLKEFEKTTDLIDRKYAMFTINRGPIAAHVFYDIDFVRQHWGRLFRILSVTPDAYGHLTAVLLGR